MPQIILANPPFVIHQETGVYKSLDDLCAYAVEKDRLYQKSGGTTANALYPMEFNIARGVRAGSRWPHVAGPIYSRYTPFPFLLAYASGYLKKHGVEAEVIDCVIARQFSYEEFIAQLSVQRPEIVLVETSQVSEEIDLWLCERIAAFSEVALAGPHITDATAVRLQADNPHIRYFLKGEYILSSLEMVRTRRPGIYESTVVDDLDAVPFPDRSFPGAELADDAWIPGAPFPQLQMWGSKGCPFRCEFCLWPQTVYKGKVCLRSPEKIMEEITEAVALHGYKHIYFDDDTFNIGNERISELCGRLKEYGLPWGIMARLDTSPLELFDLMVDSGCIGMKFGIESFDPGVLTSINKKLDPEKALATVSHLSRKHPLLTLHLNMMKDIPGQSQEIHERDMEILRSMGFMDQDKPHRKYQLASCRMFPDTQISRHAGAR